MLRNCIVLIIFCLFAFSGCATPPEIKQALVDKDEGYVENLKLMQQYRKLVGNIHERHHYWYRYTKQRLLLDIALRSMTQDYWREKNIDGEKLTKEENVDDTVIQLGGKLHKVVNELRLAKLVEQKGTAGKPKFNAGEPDNTASKIVERLPEIVNRVTEKVEEDYKKIVTGDMSHFNSYRTNVSAIRQINATIKRYLDIDVTIAPENISEISKSIQQLQQ